MLLLFIFIALPVVVMTWQIVKTQHVRCEICVQYKGQQNCRQASGDTAKNCFRTAQDNACATISSGMTESIECSDTVPFKQNILP